jgi:hypothetical protein
MVKRGTEQHLKSSAQDALRLAGLAASLASTSPSVSPGRLELATPKDAGALTEREDVPGPPPESIEATEAIDQAPEPVQSSWDAGEADHGNTLQSYLRDIAVRRC